ncbi:MAG: 3-hydroxyacyl-CoA dehydrogenase [Acidobacteriota bacterium]|jgi:3-hydroxyacyl-CoA dehydrogenase
MTHSQVRTETRGATRVVFIDNPPVNALHAGIAGELIAALDAANRDPAVAGIVVLGAGRTFVAGADITTLEPLAWDPDAPKPDLRPLLDTVESSAKPVVMAIHGTALGGGLELAMAAHYRVATAGAKLGLPECSLGIIPGAQGTQRLPRLVGVQKALDMVVTSKPIAAGDALAHGLVDEVVDGDLLDGALRFAQRVVAAGGPHPKTSARADKLGTPDVNAPLFDAARAAARKVKPQQPAPLLAIEAIEAATRLPFAAGCEREAALFLDAVRTEPAKALIHVFFAERAVARIPDLPKDVKPSPIQRVAIVGAGTMGSGIAMTCANAGLDVRLQDTSQDGIDRGLEAIRRNYATSVSRGRFTSDMVTERIGRINPQLTLEGFETADLVIEAVFEEMALKQRVFADLARVAAPGAVLGSNTSTLDIDAIASSTGRPQSVIGLHFFSPANVMRLLEIVRGTATSAATLITALGFAKAIGKVGVTVRNGPGFVGNRMMFPYMYETQYMVEEGATPEQVDKALTEFGMAMGIFAVDDMAGIDVAIRAQRALSHFSDPSERRPLVQTALVEAGRLGQKTGKGWYVYGDDRKPKPDPVVIDMIRAKAREAGIPQRTFTNTEIVERALYALINEGARVIEDRLVVRASDIDTIYVTGYGFPAWRGGPMFYADRLGLNTVYERIRAFHAEFGSRWMPAPLLERLAREGGTFRGLDRR